MVVYGLVITWYIQGDGIYKGIYIYIVIGIYTIHKAIEIHI